MRGRVHVPIWSATGVWNGACRPVSLEQGLTQLSLYRRSLSYLEWQIELCRQVMARGWRFQRGNQILGAQAAEYAHQLLDERYGKTRTTKENA